MKFYSLLLLAPIVFSRNYIVVLKKETQFSDLVNHFVFIQQVQNVQPIDIFEISDFRGYTGDFEEHQIDQIKSDPVIDFIEEDILLHAYNLEVEHNSPWNLQRVSHRKGCNVEDPFGNIHLESDTCVLDYLYDSNDGKGVTVYVIDTGIFPTHEEFEGRASYGKSFIAGSRESNDENGHGTHCSSIVAGKTFGIAKAAEVVGVKVLDENGSGSLSGVIKGIEWVTKQKTVKKVASMSLGGGSSRALDMAVNSAVDSGIFMVVAAGNENSDACNSSPAGASKVISVGATDSDDSRAYYSNVGRCVSIFAPGSDIISAWIGDEKSTNTISGTSMACPHVSAVVASLLSRPEYENFTPAQMKEEIIKLSTKGAIYMNSKIKSENRLLYSNPPVRKEEFKLDFFMQWS